MTGWSFACPDWEDRLRTGRSLLPELPLDPVQVKRAVAIYNRLRVPNVPGTPALGEVGGDWSRDIVRAIFGSLVDGYRMVPELFAMVPKKNTKTTTGAACSVTALLLNERPHADFILTAPTQLIADTGFEMAAGMIDTDPEGYLQKRFHVAYHRKEITCRRLKATLKVRTFDMDVLTGTNPAGILMDEVHLLGSKAYAARVIGQLRGGMIAVPESFLIIITTQSDEPPAGVFKSELQYARGVRDGRITSNVRMLPMLYEFPEAIQTDEEKPWLDPKLWHMVLPNLGRSITIDRLVDEFETAKEKGEDEVRRWASQHLNIEIGLALHSDRWRGADFWNQAADSSVTVERLLADCDVIVAGIDGGGLDDLFGMALLGRDKISRDWLLWSHAWAQPEVLGRRKDIAARLEDFARDGDLTLCDDVNQDIEEATELLRRIHDAGLFPEKAGIGLDPFSIGALVDRLAEAGMSGPLLQGIRQGSALSPASWGMERKLKDGTLWHAGSRLMAWCVGNAKTEQRGNAVLITKQVAGKAKIDPLVAAFNAVMLMSQNPNARTTAVSIPDNYFMSA